MSAPGDAMEPQRPIASAPVAPAAALVATPDDRSTTEDDRAERRAALRELAAMIGVEVFY